MAIIDFEPPTDLSELTTADFEIVKNYDELNER